MPTAAELFIIFLIVIVVGAIARFNTLGDNLGALLRGLVGREAREPAPAPDDDDTAS